MATQEEEPLSLPGYSKEIELPQEDRELIASLPTEKSWIAGYFMHQYQGFWFTTEHLQRALDCHKRFQAQKTDVLLVSFPKSGTTWLKAIAFALIYRSRFPDLDQHPLTTSNPHALVPFLGRESGDKPFPDDFTPRLFSTHWPYVSLPTSVEESSCKIVYLCRNPKDTFVSLWHFINKVTNKNTGEISLEESFDKFCRGVSMFGPFWDHILGYWRKRQEAPERVLFLHYEDLKKEPEVQLKRLSEFISCPFSEEEESSGMIKDILKLCSFDNISNLEVNKSGKALSSGVKHEAFFRRGQVGDAMNHLTTEKLEQIDCITEEKFQGSGLELNNF